MRGSRGGRGVDLDPLQNQISLNYMTKLPKICLGPAPPLANSNICQTPLPRWKKFLDPRIAIASYSNQHWTYVHNTMAIGPVGGGLREIQPKQRR